ncbi:enoyl-CoA hydratase/isomerase family protein [Nocardioides acrostichi]|uniref:Enoyl-CoA hydratase/isomerase family protein n=1 Tax=Nocardioides acrostichi TaxID=2784339 RepID=A0A930UVY8_9ACTN|nr:enoyl-CoA hydratase/isomerase family protein [Nocardioides acrostichi]MBF4161156.1 enoyl-CoA hydratase/isomerase family protein [Nocardioides acrostichi]
MSTPVSLDRDDAVATITLAGPALSTESKVALRDALATVADDATVRAVVLAGGPKAFCVGQDLTEHAAALEGGAEAAFATVEEHYSPIVWSLMTMPKPVVAAVTGACVGAGLGLALACDHRVLASGATLGTAFTGIGLTFDSGLSFTLPRAVGHARAGELVLLGTTFTAEDAVAWGVSGEIVATNAVLARATEVAGRLAAGPTVAFAESKALLLDVPALEAALAAEAAAQTRCGATTDHAGAVTAFLNRERPSFVGA